MKYLLSRFLQSRRHERANECENKSLSGIRYPLSGIERSATSRCFYRARRSWEVDIDRADSARHRFTAGRQNRAGEESVRGGENGIRVRVRARRVAAGTKSEHHDRHD